MEYTTFVYGDDEDTEAGEEVRENPTPRRGRNGRFLKTGGKRKGKGKKRGAKRGTRKNAAKGTRKNPPKVKKGSRGIAARVARLERTTGVLVHNMSVTRTHLTDAVNAIRRGSGMKAIKSLSGYKSMSGYGTKLARGK
jgi:hypothetical protein